MRLVDPGPNVVLRDDVSRGGRIVVLSFPYREDIVDAVRQVPGRRFDWDAREWWAIANDWSGTHVADIVRRYPELTVSDDAREWLTGLTARWIGTVTARKAGARGLFVLETRAGELPAELAELARPVPRSQLKAGDFVFFNTLNRPFSHMGIYIGNAQFVNAPSTGGQVRVDSLNNPYFAQRFESARTLFGS